MSIMQRIKRLVQGNVHEALDRMENPEVILKQRVRELETAIRLSREAVASFGVTFKKTEKEQEQLKRLEAEWAHAAEKAVAVGDEALARQALAEKLKAQERLRALEPGLAQSRRTFQDLKERLAPLQDQLAEAKLKLAELASRQRAAQAQKTFGDTLQQAACSSVEGGAFERMEQKVLQTEAEADIQQDLAGSLPALDRELNRQIRQSQVDAELDALKKKLKS